MILHTSVLALASALVAGSLTLASVAPSPVANSAPAAEDLLIHGATASAPAPAAPPPLAVYDSLGHAQLSPAETYCDAHQTVTQGLTHDFAETFRARKISADGLQIELWASDLMGTWTALHHGDDGISCIVASGVDWSISVSADDLLQLAMHEVVYSW